MIRGNILYLCWIGKSIYQSNEFRFGDLKRYISSPLLLPSLDPNEPLFLYLAMFEHAVNTVIVRIKKNIYIQRLVHYISKTLNRP